MLLQNVAWFITLPFIPARKTGGEGRKRSDRANKKNCDKINSFYSNPTLLRAHQLNIMSGGKYVGSLKGFLKRIHLMFQRPQGALLKSLARDTSIDLTDC